MAARPTHALLFRPRLLLEHAFRAVDFLERLGLGLLHFGHRANLGVGTRGNRRQGNRHAKGHESTQEKRRTSTIKHLGEGSGAAIERKTGRS